jgi:transcriptional regulator with XRE-family HTH domain
VRLKNMAPRMPGARKTGWSLPRPTHRETVEGSARPRISSAWRVVIVSPVVVTSHSVCHHTSFVNNKCEKLSPGGLCITFVWFTMAGMSNTTVPDWDLHHRLARALEWGNVSPEEMANELGVHVNSIYNYAAGRRIPKRGFIRQWAALCNVPGDWLEYGDPPPDSADTYRSIAGYSDILMAA